MPELKVGSKVGRLTVLEIIPPTFHVTVKVRCQCGVQKTVFMTNLASGRTKSCGCLKQERREQNSGRK